MWDPSCETGAERTGSVGTGVIRAGGGRGFSSGVTGGAGPGPHRYFSPAPRKKTVKELLVRKRQRNNLFQDESSTLEPQPDLCPDPGRLPATPLTLFQWQIQQEERRVAGTAAELLGWQDADGDTVLHIAVAQGKRALAYVLAPKMAERGVLDLKEHNGQTALQIAVATNNHLIVRDLLSQGANVNTHDLWGRSPLHVCAQKGHALSLQTIWKTLQPTGQQLDTEMYDYEGFTPLHAAAASHNAVLKELRDVKNLCVFRRVELEGRGQRFAATAKLLLLMGASVGAKDLKSGRTCLHLASEEANLELLMLFLDSSTSTTAINAAAYNGNTPLHMVGALQASRRQAAAAEAAAKLLLARGADPRIRNLENELPWQLAPEGPSGETVRRILKGKRFQR